MILVDTSIWVDHMRTGVGKLTELLNASRVLMHPFVLGELACGNLHDRTTVLALFKNLPQATRVTDDEALFFIEQHALTGRGIGYVDVHLLAAVALTGSAKLWTRDKRLQTVAEGLALAYEN